MANQQRPGHDKHETNGLAHDMGAELKQQATQLVRYPRAQGYILMAAGAALLLFSIGFFPIIKWLVGAAGVAMILLGTVRSHVIESITNYVQSFRK